MAASNANAGFTAASIGDFDALWVGPYGTQCSDHEPPLFLPTANAFEPVRAIAAQVCPPARPAYCLTRRPPAIGDVLRIGDARTVVRGADRRGATLHCDAIPSRESGTAVRDEESDVVVGMLVATNGGLSAITSLALIRQVVVGLNLARLARQQRAEQMTRLLARYLGPPWAEEAQKASLTQAWKDLSFPAEAFRSLWPDEEIALTIEFST